LYLIDIFGSKELTRLCAKAILIEPSRTTQTPYMATNFHKNHGDELILKAQT